MKKYLYLMLAAMMLLSTVSVFAEAPAEEAAPAHMLGDDPIYDGIMIEPNRLMDYASTVTPADDVAKTTTLTPAYSAIPLNTAKTNPVARPQIIAGVNSKTSDDELNMWKQMGINAVELSIGDDELSYEVLYPVVERLRNFPNGGFEILLASNYTFQKDRIIHLQLEGWEEEIERFNDYLRLMSRLNIRTVAIAWQPNGISRSGDTPKSIHGANAGATNMEGIDPMELKNDRYYTREEMWKTFGDFLERVIPVCEETNVRMALHPNDPPVPYLGGVGSLVMTADDYRRAFELAGDSPYLGMKLCTGCWTEGGLLFTNDMLGDIDEFVRRGKVFEVHFRNVTAPLNADYSGYFEECLAEDGYADMYELMLQFIRSGYNGPIFCDHTHRSINAEVLGSSTNRATSDAWIQGLIYAARAQVLKEISVK
jgi:mannonate dehydratase